jgi:hypothetical protein
MVSGMESTEEARQALAAAERAATLPYTTYPPTPRWFPIAAGTWSAGVVVTVALLGDENRWALALFACLIALELAYLRWYRRRHGVMPSLRNVPSELTAVMRGYWWGTVAVVGCVCVAYFTAGPVAAAALAFVLVTGGLAWYERRYTAAAAATRRRVS